MEEEKKTHLFSSVQFSSVQFSSVVQSCMTLCNPMNHSMPCLPVHTNSRNLPKLMSIESVMHPTISFSVIPFSSCPQSFTASVQFTHSVVSDSLWPHEPQHARPPCPSPTPGVYSNSCPLTRWCHLTISSSIILFSSFLQSFPTSGSFQRSHLFASGGKNIGVSASTSVIKWTHRTDFL